MTSPSQPAHNPTSPRIILYIATSLDGFIATPDGGVAWLDAFQSSGEDYGYHEFYDQIGVVVMGATTYEQVRQLMPDRWAYAPLRSYVLTHRELTAPDEDDVHFYRGDVSALAQIMRDDVTQSSSAEAKPHIWLVGGGAINRAFLQAGLIDTLIISVMPVILGAGIPLFGNQATDNVPDEHGLHLTHSQTFADGVVQLHYALHAT